MWLLVLNIFKIPVVDFIFFFLLVDYVYDILLLSYSISFYNPIINNLLLISLSDYNDNLSSFNALTGFNKFLLNDDLFLELADIVLRVLLSGLYMIVLFRWDGLVYNLSLSYLKSYLSAFFSKWISISVKLAFFESIYLMLCIYPFVANAYYWMAFYLLVRVCIFLSI